MEHKVNAGYTLTDMISVGGSTYVMGFNPNNSLVPYVTWEASEDLDYFVHGHYISNREDALVDLIKRATEYLEIGGQPFSRQMLTKEDKEAIHEEVETERRKEIISESLLDSAENLHLTAGETEKILASQAFMDEALKLCWNEDFQQETDALFYRNIRAAIKNVLEQDFPDLLPQKFSADLKISPEEMDIMNDVLSLTSAEIEEKYGPFETKGGVLEFYQDIPSAYGDGTMFINIAPKETPEGGNAIHLMLMTPERDEMLGTMDEATLKNVASLEQIFSMQDKQGRTWSVDLHADERLRRIGRDFIFHTDSDEHEYTKHNGQKCVIEGMLSKKDADLLTVGLMWKVRFEDGSLLDAYDTELSPNAALQYDLAIHPKQIKPSPEAPNAADAFSKETKLSFAETLADAKFRAEQSAAQNTAPELQR